MAETEKVYEADDSIIGQALGGKGDLKEIVETSDDGSKDVYEADNSIVGQALGGKGDKIEHVESSD